MISYSFQAGSEILGVKSILEMSSSMSKFASFINGVSKIFEALGALFDIGITAIGVSMK